MTKTMNSTTQKIALLGIATLVLTACDDGEAEHGNVFDARDEENSEPEPQPADSDDESTAEPEGAEAPDAEAEEEASPEEEELEEDEETEEEPEEEEADFSGFSGEHLEIDTCDLITGEEFEEIYGLPYEEGELTDYLDDPEEPEAEDELAVQRRESCFWSVDLDELGVGIGTEYTGEFLQVSVTDYVFNEDNPESRQESSDALWEEGKQVFESEDLTGFHHEAFIEYGGFQPNSVIMRVEDTRTRAEV